MTNRVSLAQVFILRFEGVRVGSTPPELKAMVDDHVSEVATLYKGKTLSEIPAVKAVRAIFHETGVDPTRYRPSSEALLRRAVKGQRLYFINSAVDVLNYFSLRYCVPMGLFDADRIRGSMTFRPGRPGETYVGVGRASLNLEGFPLLADDEGPFGSAVSDSVRTQVTEAATRLLWATFAPNGIELDFDAFGATMVRFNGGAAGPVTQL